MKIKAQICWLIPAIEIALDATRPAKEFFTGESAVIFKHDFASIRRQCEVIDQGVVSKFIPEQWQRILEDIRIAQQHKINEVILHVTEESTEIINPTTLKTFTLNGKRKRFFKLFFLCSVNNGHATPNQKPVSVNLSSDSFPSREQMEEAVREKRTLGKHWDVENTGIFEFANEEDYTAHFWPYKSGQ